MVDAKVLCEFTQHCSDSMEGEKFLPITSLVVSNDGQWLAAGDQHNRINIFNLDTLKHHVQLPKMTSLHTCLAFYDASTLVIACASNEFFLYDVERKQMNAWTRTNSSHLPYQWLRKNSKIVGISVDNSSPKNRSLILHDHYSMAFVDLSKVCWLICN